jgi:hypothetical protein
MLRMTEEQLAARQVKHAPAQFWTKPIVGTPMPPAEVKARAKYGNVKTTVDGITFDSKREAKHYDGLLILQATGLIRGLQRQVKYVLIPRQNDAQGKCLFRAVTYTADFTYWSGDQFVVEDAKGYPDPRWPMKKALMHLVYGILVREV